MPIRFFDWRDLADLNSIRHDSLFLFNELLLTAGTLRALETFVSSILPLSRTYTLVSTAQPAGTLFGQIVQRSGDDYAYVALFAPASRMLDEENRTGFLGLLDSLATLAGERGALRLLADVEEHSTAFEILHCSGFSVLTHQRVWNIPAQDTPQKQPSISQNWRQASQQDWIAIQALYNNLVPALVQKVGAAFCKKPRGGVYYQTGEIIAYIEIHYGIHGICAYPFIHPDAEEPTAELSAVLGVLPGLPARLSRPVYACVSHYQSWLESALEEQGAQPGARQVLMAKHLTVRQKVVAALAVPGMKEGRANTIAG